MDHLFHHRVQLQLIDNCFQIDLLNCSHSVPWCGSNWVHMYVACVCAHGGVRRGSHWTEFAKSKTLLVIPVIYELNIMGLVYWRGGLPTGERSYVALITRDLNCSLNIAYVQSNKLQKLTQQGTTCCITCEA